MIVLDTHVLIWLLEGNQRLGRRACRLIETAFANDELTVSAISFWEIAMLQECGRLRLSQALDSWRSAVLELGVIELPVTGVVGIAAATLQNFHGDPADRIITVTAQQQGAALITADQRILKWISDLERYDAAI